MPRSPGSGYLDLAEVFYSVQEEMLAQLAVGGFFEHPSAAGTAAERHWLNLFDRYLPKRYRATPAFIIDSEGRRSRQIDIAIFDNLCSPLLFPHASGLHVPAESVHAVFEVKPTFSRQWIREAGEKAASVRALNRTSIPETNRLDLGCSLQHGSFEQTDDVTVSIPEETLIFLGATWNRSKPRSARVHACRVDIRVDVRPSSGVAYALPTG